MATAKVSQSHQTSAIESGKPVLSPDSLPIGGALPYLSRMSGLPESLYAQGALAAHGHGIEPSAFYSLVSISSQKGMKDFHFYTNDMSFLFFY